MISVIVIRGTFTGQDICKFDGAIKMESNVAHAHFEEDGWRDVIKMGKAIAVGRRVVGDYQAAGSGIKKPRNR